MYTIMRKSAITLMKELKRQVQGDLLMVKNQQFGTVSALLQKVKEVLPPVEDQQIPFPQVDVPDYMEVYPGEPQVVFRGLQSDFPCVSRK